MCQFFDSKSSNKWHNRCTEMGISECVWLPPPLSRLPPPLFFCFACLTICPPTPTPLLPFPNPFPTSLYSGLWPMHNKQFEFCLCLSVCRSLLTTLSPTPPNWTDECTGTDMLWKPTNQVTLPGGFHPFQGRILLLSSPGSTGLEQPFSWHNVSVLSISCEFIFAFSFRFCFILISICWLRNLDSGCFYNSSYFRLLHLFMF